MTPEQNLIQQLSKILENRQLDNQSLLEELAEQYAELCSQVNTRLLRCAEYLHKGLLSEAVHEAQSAPNLLELAALIQFEQARKWMVVCDDLGLRKPPLLHTEILEELREACTQEKSLQPLLREFRRLVYQGLQSEAIPILRKIRLADPDNTSWQSNLRTFEEADLPKWVEKAQSALQNDDLQQLRLVYAELSHPQRMVPAPPELLQRLQRALLAEKAAELKLEAENLLKRMQEALQKQDLSNLEQLLLRSRQLETEEAFYQHPEGWSQCLRQSEEMLAANQEELAKQAQFEQELNEFCSAFNTESFKPAELRDAWRNLQAKQGKLPEGLQEQVETRLLEMNRRQKRQRDLRQLLVTAFSALLLLLLVISAYGWQQSRQRQAVVKELMDDYEQARFQDMRYKLDNLKHYRPKVYNHAQVQSLEYKLKSALSEQGERSRNVEELMASLDEVRRSGYMWDEAEIRSLLDRAELMLLTEAEKRRLNSWKEAWANWRASQRHESNAVLQRVCTQFRSARSSISTLNLSDFGAERKKLEELRLLFESALPHLNRADQTCSDEFLQCQNQLETWQDDLRQREEEQAKQILQARAREQQEENLKKELFQTLPNLQRYAAKLGELQDFFGGKLPAELHNALENLPVQSRALVLQDFVMRSLPGSREQEEQLRAFLAEDGSALASVWEADLRAALSYLDNSNEVRRKVRLLALEQVHMFQVYSIEIKKKNETQWQRLYVPALPASRQEKDAQGNEYTLYWGNFFYAEFDDDVPEETHTSKVFPNGLNTLEYDIKVGRKAQEALSSQGKFLMAFVLEAQNQSELDIHVLQALQQLADPELDMEVIPRTWLQKRLLNFLADNFSADIPESHDWAQAINQINTDLPWMNAKHPLVLQSIENIRRAAPFYTDLEPLQRRLQLNRGLLAQALSRKVHCVGALQRDADSTLVPRLTLLGSGKQLWVLNCSSPQRPPFWQVLSFDGRELQNDVLFNCYEGQLLFEPQNFSFAQLDFEQVEAGKVVKPHSWPINLPLH
ncbi:MAG: hypothetical protein GX946_01880 [Oligosphaeraceae bacterium]|nr:hypothetical protein [Oligosphaeraceae bacterium]